MLIPAIYRNRLMGVGGIRHIYKIEIGVRSTGRFGKICVEHKKGVINYQVYNRKGLYKFYKSIYIYIDG